MKRVSISFHKMYGLLYLSQTVYLLYLIISGHLQTTENFKKPFGPQRVKRQNGESNVRWFLFSMNPDAPAFNVCIFTNDYIFVSPALEGKTNRDHFVHCCCCLWMLLLSVVKTG